MPVWGSAAGRGRRWSFLALCVVLLVGIVATAVLRWGLTPGPLGEPDPTPFGTLTTADRPVGVAMTFGVIFLSHGSDRVVLESARPASRPPWLRVLGFSVISMNENTRGAPGGAEGYPPKGYVLHPVPGFAFAPATTPAVIVVGLAATAPGAHAIGSFVLDYRIGSSHYEATYGDGAGICTDRRACSEFDA